jgi:hypothetical protein
MIKVMKKGSARPCVEALVPQKEKKRNIRDGGKYLYIIKAI